MRANANVLLALFIGILCSPANAASDGPEPGSRYEIIRPLYLMATYNDRGIKKISRETARAYLHSMKYADKSDVAFQVEVPAGTTMIVIGSAPKVWHLPFLPKRYFAQLTPDPSRGLDVILELDRGIDGDVDGLNIKLFRPVR